jgi:predicted DNA binding CopG/RHH family protein
MKQADKHASGVDAWDSGDLGRDEQFVKLADPSALTALEKALNLKMISIRLPEDLIENLKLIGLANNVGYQPLIRDVLDRFVVCEIKQMMQDAIKRRKEQSKKLEQEKAEVQKSMNRLRDKKAA